MSAAGARGASRRDLPGRRGSTLLALVALLAVGCGGAPPATTPTPTPQPTPRPLPRGQTFLGISYFCTAGPGITAVSVHYINPASGDLSASPGGTAAGYNATALAMSPYLVDSRYLYVGAQDIRTRDFTLRTYRFAGDYRLTRTAVLDLEDAASAIAVDPRGRFLVATVGGGLFGSHDRGGTLASFTLADAAQPLLTHAVPVPFGRSTDMAIDPGAANVYVSSSDGGIAAWTIDQATGRLTPLAGSPFGDAGVRRLAMHPSGALVFAAETRGRIRTFRREASGALRTTRFSAPAQLRASDFAVDPGGRFVYAVDRLIAAVYGWEVDLPTGQLMPIPGSPFSTGENPNAVAVDPSGRYLYTAIDPNPYYRDIPQEVWGYGIDAETGALTPLRLFPYAPPTVSCPFFLTTAP